MVTALLAVALTSGSSLAAPALQAEQPLVLASGRQARCCVVVAMQGSPGERAAAALLQDYLQRIARADVPLVRADQAGAGVRLLVGCAAAAMLGGELSAANLGPDGFILRSSAKGDAIAIAGANDSSTQTAVTGFLEMLGCRWYMPGEIGEVVPRQPELGCPALSRTEIPDFYHRVLWNNGWVVPTLTAEAQAEYAEWFRRNRLGGLPADHGHAYDRLVPPDRYFADHPDYFSLVRNAGGTTARVRDRQLCTSNPDVIAIAARSANDALAADPSLLCVSLSPNDTGGFCECDACRALDGRGPNGLSDRILTFKNAVAERVDAEHPGRLVAYYALYGNLPGPPTTVRPRVNVMPAMVHTACHLHAITDPACPVNRRWREQVARWRGMSRQLFAYDYFQYSDIPTPINETIGDNIRFYRDMGCLGFSGEILGRSQITSVALYIAARMLWDADQDPLALLDEFCHSFYGPLTGRPMREYYATWEAAARGQVAHGVAFTPPMLTPDLAGKLEKLLTDADKEAIGNEQHRRVEMAALDLRATTLYAQAWQAAESWASAPTPAGQEAALTAIGAAEEFLKSIADQDIVAEGILLGRLAEMKDRVTSGKAAPARSARSQPGYDDAATFGDLWTTWEDLGSLPTDGWAFHTDARNEGDRKGWGQPTFDDSRWPLVDIGEFWEVQRGEYDGVAWYRRVIDLPEAVGKGGCVLWFGATDESAWVYLDGKPIGAHDEGEVGWDRRFRIDLPAGVTPGPHLLAVKVLDRALMGGLWKSIKLARPKAE
jgi:Domain of unknown function (DUF4838)/Beta-galactosidase second all-beta domain